MQDKRPARRVSFKGRVEFRHEADDLAPAAGDSVMVVRGRPRSLVMACPDGCGEHLTINLDERAGPAWRWFENGRGLTLFPSVWRDSGCKSHFIVWHNVILWCDSFIEGNQEPENLSPGLVDEVLAILNDHYMPFPKLAKQLGEIPWDVSRACRILKVQGLADEDEKPRLGCYRRAASP